MLKQIIEKAGAADAAAVMEGLKTMSGFEGVTGDWDMGADRRVDRPIVIIGIENNQYNFVELMVPEWKPDP
jgi:ABC-type branched-subunit amino acid transport system substrate-binding protein